jgi:hypothetical protein
MYDHFQWHVDMSICNYKGLKVYILLDYDAASLGDWFPILRP